MKVATAGAVKTNSKPTPNRLVPVDQILKAKDFPYRPNDPAHVDSLFNDIRVNGLDVPLITFAEKEGQLAQTKGSDKTFPATFLVAGSHRLAAIKKLRAEDKKAFDKHFPTGEVPVLHRVWTPQEALFGLLRENVQRREMSAEEIFPVLEKLTGAPYNLKGKEIAAKIGKSPAWVSQHLAVTEELDEETKDEVMNGEIEVGAARELAADVRKKRKAGETVSTKEIREKAGALKEKHANKVATGSQRASGDDRRVSAKKLLGRIEALPTGLALGRKVIILTDAFRYVAGATEKLPAELRKDPPKQEEKKPAPAKKK